MRRKDLRLLFFTLFVVCSICNGTPVEKEAEKEAEVEAEKSVEPAIIEKKEEGETSVRKGVPFTLISDDDGDDSETRKKECAATTLLPFLNKT